VALHHAGGGFSEATRTEAVAEGRGIQSQVGQGHSLTEARTPLVPRLDAIFWQQLIHESRATSEASRRERYENLMRF
jgi:hypothetical protein